MRPMRMRLLFGASWPKRQAGTHRALGCPSVVGRARVRVEGPHPGEPGPLGFGGDAELLAVCPDLSGVARRNRSVRAPQILALLADSQHAESAAI